MTTNQISLNPRSTVRILAIAAILIVLCSIAGQLVAHLTGHAYAVAFADITYVDKEKNIPTAFSVFVLLFASVLLAVISALAGTGKDSRLSYWSVLSFGFLLMAVDEAWSFHERLIQPMRELLGRDSFGILYYAWVVPAFALVFVLALFFAKFLARLPARTRYLFLLAATLYLGGALGMELVAGRFNEYHGLADTKGSLGTLHLAYSMLATIEESLEMAGVILFNWSLLSYIGENYGEVRFKITDAGSYESSAALRSKE